jgi:hypothetical protein
MILFALMLAVQVSLVVHVVRNDRPIYWIFLIMFLPAVGTIAYFIVEILPGLSGNQQARSTIRNIKKSLDPEADLREHEKRHRLSGSVEAARGLAAELRDAGRFDESIQHYEKALTGLYERDPDLMLGLAQSQFAKKDFQSAAGTLDDLMLHNPEFRSQDGHLLYARANEELGNLDKAESEFKAVASYYAGAEAETRYAALLEKLGKNESALALYEEVVNSADLAPKHYQSAQKKWIAEAKDGVKRLASARTD